MNWSWTALVTAYGGDEKRALRQLARMVRQVRLTTVQDPRSDVRYCRWGHEMTIKNGIDPESGDQRWVCRECQTERRKHQRDRRAAA